jgi:hypothetical protein
LSLIFIEFVPRPASRYTLAALSPVFEKMCLGTFKEASDRHAALEDEKFDEVKELFCTIMTTEDEIMLKPVTGKRHR